MVMTGALPYLSIPAVGEQPRQRRLHDLAAGSLHGHNGGERGGGGDDGGEGDSAHRDSVVVEGVGGS
jgi:hypothetical protein